MIGVIKKMITKGKTIMFDFINTDEAIEFINDVPEDEPILLTIGLSYRNPNTHNKPLTHEEAIEWAKNHGNNYTLEASTYNGAHHLNAYTANDLW